MGWARERWTDPLFTDTFPSLASEGMLSRGAQIWLPNLQCIDQSIRDFGAILQQYFYIRKECSPESNPLCRATDDVKAQLLLCPDNLTNETQMKPLFDYSDEPFWVLELRDEFLKVPNTPEKLGRRGLPISVLVSGKTTTVRKRERCASDAVDTKESKIARMRSHKITSKALR